MNIYELIIIGGGPAGCAAAIYAARKRIKTLMILNEWGGQSNVSHDVQNWIGTAHITGQELANNLKAHVLEYKDQVLDIKENSLVKNVSKSHENIFQVDLENSEEKFFSQAVLIASGSNRKKLNIPGAEEFEHKGLTYCATCDGPLFADLDVIVIGGGNSAFESALQLLVYCKSVTQIVKGETKAEEITIQKILKNPKFKLIRNAIPKEVHGDKFVTGFTYTNSDCLDCPDDIKLEVSGIFVEIGQSPATNFVKNICQLTNNGNIKIDHINQATSELGIWAAGDCTDVLYHQNNIAAGDAVKAIEDIHKFLK